MANNWKRVKVDFSTVKLGDFIEPIKRIFSDLNDEKYATVYGVSNTDGICITGKESSKDISKYIILEDDCFAFNPYRINVGSIGINDKRLKGCVSPAYVVFKTNKKLNPYFLYYYLKSEYGNHLINWYGNRGGVRNALRYDDLCQIDIPNIDLPTQLVLLKDIQKYNAIYENLCYESANQSSYLTKFRQAILQEAIEGKLTADWRKENPVRKGDPDYDAEALLEKIKAFWKINNKSSRGLKNGQKKEFFSSIPSWICTNIDSIGIAKVGGTPSRANPKYWGKEIPWVSSGEVANCEISKTNEMISESGSKNSAAKILPKGTVLVAMIGQGKTRGQTAILNINATTNQNVCGIVIDHNFINPNFLFYYFLQRYEESRSFASGGNQPALNGQKIGNFNIALPPLAEQQAIVDRIEKLLSMTDELEKQVTERKEQSEQLMQAVLREAFEGGK